MLPRADGFDLVAGQESRLDLKARYIPRTGRLRVLIPRDLSGVALVQHRIEDRLFGKPWRKRAKPRLLDQRQFLRADRPVQVTSSSAAMETSLAPIDKLRPGGRKDAEQIGGERSMDGVRVERRGAVLEVTLDRPKANAIDAAASRALGEAFATLRDDPELLVGIVTGGG